MIYTTSATNTDISYDITTDTYTAVRHDFAYDYDNWYGITWGDVIALDENIECLSIRTQKDIDDEKLMKLFKEPL
jgi:hypothetical protein